MNPFTRHPSIIGAFALVMLLICIVGIARAQAADDVTLSIKAASQGPGQAIPTLTWSTTTPAPTSCAASGDTNWSGTKAASGTFTLPVVTANKNYVLACTFVGDSQASISWTASITNADGTALTDLASYKVYWNSGDPSMVTAPTAKTKSVPPAISPTTTVTGLTPGTWFFAVTAINAGGVESAISNIASKAIGAGATVTKNAALIFPGTTVITVR